METPLGNTIEALRAASSGKHWITACARLRVYAFQANHPHWCVYVCMSVRVNESEGSVGRGGRECKLSGVLSQAHGPSSPHIQLLKQISEQPFNPQNLIADIKCENILLAAGPEGSFTIKLVDMGSSLFKSWWHPPIIGTMEYRAPETLLQVCIAQRRTSECPSDLSHAE